MGSWLGKARLVSLHPLVLRIKVGEVSHMYAWKVANSF